MIMRGFDDVSFEWKGAKFVIPANKVMGAIARVEDIITLHELQRYSSKQSTPLAKLSMAYGALLRYAGCQVNDVEIYESMFGKGNVSANIVVESIVTLISMMVPPAAYAGDDKAGKMIAAAAKEVATNSSSLKKHTRLRSRSGK